MNNKNLPASAKNEIEKHLFGLFSGLTWHFWMSGKTLGAAWEESAKMVGSFVSGRAKNNPTNPVVRYIREYSATRLAKFLEHAKTNATRNDKMNLPPQKYSEYEKMGVKWTNEGIHGLNRQIKAYESKAAPLMPYQVALMTGAINQRSAA
jgi:hypothetical protein